MTTNVADLVPVIPTGNGKAAWIAARIDQVGSTLRRGVTVHEAWIEVSANTAADLITELGTVKTRYAGQVLDGHIDTASGTIPVSICITNDMDDTSFLLSLELNDHRKSIATSGLLGFCYPTPMNHTDIQTRWVLQHVDGIDAHTAATITAVL